MFFPWASLTVMNSLRKTGCVFIDSKQATALLVFHSRIGSLGDAERQTLVIHPERTGNVPVRVSGHNFGFACIQVDDCQHESSVAGCQNSDIVAVGRQDGTSAKRWAFKKIRNGNGRVSIYADAAKTQSRHDGDLQTLNEIVFQGDDS
jgi:hypothetical protein